MLAFARSRSMGRAYYPVPRHFELLSQIRLKLLTQMSQAAQDLQFLAKTHTVSNRNRPAKQVGGQRWLNQHSLNRGSTRTKLVLCAVSASPECLMNHGELRRLRTGSPAHCSRPRGPDFYLSGEDISPPSPRVTPLAR